MVLVTPSNVHLTRTTVDTVDWGKRALRKSIAARYTPAFGRPAEAGRRAGGGKKLRNAGSCRRPCSSAKAARGPATVSSGTGRGGAGPSGAVSEYANLSRLCTILATL